MQLFMVWDKKGEPFEVLPAKAKSLVINSGWSMEPPAQATTTETASPTLLKPAHPAGQEGHTIYINTKV